MTYKQLLKDNAFLQWRFTPNSEIVKFWEESIKNNPELTEEIVKADKYLKKRYFNASHLQVEDENMLLEKILATLQNRSQRKKQMIPAWVRYSVAAGIAILIAVGSIQYFGKKQTAVTRDDIIVGSKLDSKEIQLISNNKTTSFQENISIEIDTDGVAKIKTDDSSDDKAAVDIHEINTLVVPYGKRSTLTLSDGSKVWLNSGSVLEFPSQFLDKNREIHLASGEMYIEVAPNKQKPFHVRTSDFNVRVYGTKFNISMYPGASQSVVLVEGSVALQSSNQKQTLLSPAEQAIYSENGIFNIQKVDIDLFISWKSGYLEFNKTSMTEVLKQISRYYNLSFDFDNDVNLQRRTCTGKIYLSENLDNVMTTVGLLSSTKYIKNNNQIFIINEPN